MRRALFATLPALFACAGGAAETFQPLAPPPAEEGFQLKFDFEAAPGTEAWKCIVGPLPAPDGFHAVGRVESRQISGVHHMDIMALALTGVSLEHGVYDCATLYRERPSLMEDGIYIYASQLESESIVLPTGVAAFIPGGLDVMYEVHYVNTTDQPVNVWSRVNAYYSPDGDSAQSIWGGALRDLDLAIPPGRDHVEWTRCVMNEDVDVLFLSSHTHERGRRVTIRTFDGAEVGEEIYMNDDWHRPYLKTFDPPLTVRAGTGFELECRFDNPLERTLSWGFGAEDEMCQFGFVFTPGKRTVKCEAVAASN